jgi:acetolactate synthase-1/2/3 large subunit
MLGMHGSYEANMAMYECDLMIAIGVRFDDRITGKLEKFSPNSQKIHIDIDSKEFNKNVKVAITIKQDAVLFLNDLYELLLKNQHKIKNISTWWQQIEQWRSVDSFAYNQDFNKTILPQFALDTLYKKTKHKEPFFVTDVGQHQMWAAQYCKVNKPKRFISSSGLGTMGFGLPAAIGMQVANKDDTIVLITGDGSFMMTMNEMAVIKKYKLPIKIVLLNNSNLGMVRQWQEMFFDKNFSEVFLKQSNPNFVNLAQSFDIKARKVSNAKEVENAIIEMINHNDAYLLEIVVSGEENVYPMIPSGKGHNEVILRSSC